MNRLYRLISFSQGLTIGDYPTIEEAWAAVTQNKGRMILWEMTKTPPGWIWKQMPLKFYPWNERVTFKIKGTLKPYTDPLMKKVRETSWFRSWSQSKGHRESSTDTKAGRVHRNASTEKQ